MTLTEISPNQTNHPAARPHDLQKRLNAPSAAANSSVSDSFHSPRFSGNPSHAEKPSLIKALSPNDPAKLQEALNKGADIHEKYQEPDPRKFFSRILGGNPQYNEMNALHVAVNRNKVNPDCLKILLNRGININARESKTGWTALHRHMYQSQPNEAVTKTLLEQGVDVNAKDAQGMTALHELIDCRTATTPKQPILKLLREYGADLHARDNKGRSPLDIIAERSNPDLDVAQYLIRSGETPQEREMLKYNFLLKFQRANRDSTTDIFGGNSQQNQQVFNETRDAINAISTKKLTGKEKLNFKLNSKPNVQHQPPVTTATQPAPDPVKPTTQAEEAQEVQEVQQPDNQPEVKAPEADKQPPAKKEESTSLWNRFLDGISKLFTSFLNLFKSKKKQTSP